MNLLTIKSFVVIAGLFLIAACGSQTSSDAPVTDATVQTRMGSHGMALLGSTDILLNHMALYRTPHDRQILTPARIQNAQDKAAFEVWRSEFNGLVSIVPENFDLNRLSAKSDNPITSFTADIYEGHFERGGKVKFEGIDFELDQPVLHQPVADSEQVDEWFTYIAHGERAYLVRDIGGRPGRDEILGVVAKTEMVSGTRFRMTMKEALGNAVILAGENDAEVEFQPISLAYLETADFQ